LTDDFIGKIFVHIPKTLYNICNKPTCMQTERITVYKAAVWTNLFMVWRSGCNVSRTIH